MDASNLVWSIKNGDLDAVKEIIEKSVSFPLLWFSSSSDVCVFVLQNININNLYDGRHLIHFGSDYGHNDIIEYLIQKGADVNVGLIVDLSRILFTWDFLFYRLMTNIQSVLCWRQSGRATPTVCALWSIMERTLMVSLPMARATWMWRKKTRSNHFSPQLPNWIASSWTIDFFRTKTWHTFPITG